MTAEEMWAKSGFSGEYDAWSFGDACDKLAALVRDGIKTATCSAWVLYEAEGEDLPEEGEYNIILDSDDNAVCITKTTRVYVVPFSEVTAEHAFKEGEGDRSLTYWREVHQTFFTEELKEIEQDFDPSMKVVCEEFEVVYK